MRSDNKDKTGVVVTGGITPNCLGVVRCFGRRGIPMILLDSEKPSMVSYSRYIKKRVKCTGADQSEDEFIGVLMDLGRQLDNKMILISTRDGDVLAISRHKRELEQFYHVPMPAYDTVEKLVHKRSFYKMLGEMGIPYPKTWFPESLDEVGRIGRDIAYPFIIKPSYSPAFQWRFGLKLFVINSAQELETAIKRLDGSNLDVFIQEIIPGRRVYEFFTCLNGESEPLAVCGWDKIRSYPTDFGTGTFCESVWRPAAVECGIRFLRAVGYSGIAAPELKRDTRDGEYKFLEVNPRVTLQNGMAAACGVDIVYIAYLDVSGDYISELVAPREGVLWVDDFVDMLSFVIYLLRGEVGFGEMLKSLRPRKVHSVLSWDDPLPGIVRMGQAGCSALRKLSRK